MLVFFSKISAQAITPNVNAEKAAKVAKRATAALVSIMVLLIFSPILNIAREHIKVWVVLAYKARGCLYTYL